MIVKWYFGRKIITFRRFKTFEIVNPQSGGRKRKVKSVDDKVFDANKKPSEGSETFGRLSVLS